MQRALQVKWGKGGERDSDDLSCPQYAIKCLPAGGGAGSVQHSDAAGQDALNSTSVGVKSLNIFRLRD